MILTRPGNIAEDVAVKAPVRAATTAAITLSGLQTIDGVALGEGDRVLVKDQSDATLNGIYTAASGNWQRTADASKNTDFVDGTLVFVAQGRLNAGHLFAVVTTDNPIVFGSSAIVYLDQTDVLAATMSATSATSASLSTGPKTFATQSGKAFVANQLVLIYSAANPANVLLAKITAYAGSSLSVNVVAVGGAGGPYADWVIVLFGSPAAAGIAPPLGSGNVTGPGSSTAGHAAVFADSSGLVLGDGGPLGALASLDLVDNAHLGAGSVRAGNFADGAAPLPSSATNNLSLANNFLDSASSIDVGPGRCRSLDDTVNLALAATMTKKLQSAGAWAPGSGGNGLGAGTKTGGTVYDLSLIGKVGMAVAERSRLANFATLKIVGHGLGAGSTLRLYGVGAGYDGLWPVSSVVDADHLTIANAGADEAIVSLSAALADGFDLVFGGVGATPTMPAGYTVRKVLGSVVTDGSNNVRPFFQLGDEFYYVNPVQDFSGIVSSAATAVTVTAPVNVIWFGNIYWNNGSGGLGLASSIPQTDSPASVSAAPGVNLGGGSGAGGRSGAAARIPVTSAAQIRLRGEQNNNTVLVVTVGWRDLRRRFF